MAEICTCASLRQATRHVTRLYDEALAPSGLGLNQYSILAKLGRHGPKIQQDLAALLVMDRSTLGHLLRPLEAKGLVTTAKSAGDRRQRLVALTAEGEALLAVAKQLWKIAEVRFQQVFGPAEAESLRGVLDQVAATDFGPLR